MSKKNIIECGEDVYKIHSEVIKDFFSELSNANFKLLFYDKKKYIRGQLARAYIRTVGEMEKFLSTDKVDGGFDYFIFFDKNIWNKLEGKDRVRTMRHELRHCFKDTDSKNPWKLVGHDIEEFYEEIRLATDEGDLEWAKRVHEIGMSVYAKDD